MTGQPGSEVQSHHEHEVRDWGVVHLDLYWLLSEGIPKCTGAQVRVRSETDIGMTATMLRRLPWDRFLEDGRRQAAQTDRITEIEIGEKQIIFTYKHRQRYDDDHWRNVAQLYSDLARESSKPTAQLAELSGVNFSTASKWVMRAREKGFLPRTTQGRAKPQPSPGDGRD